MKIMLIKETTLWLSLCFSCILLMGYLTLAIEFESEKKEVYQGKRVLACILEDPRYPGAVPFPMSPEQVEIERLGHQLFAQNCTQCHAINQKIVGPPLKSILSRRDLDWAINFIKYPQKTIEGGDPYAQALYQEYQQYMPNHDFLNDDEIKAIIAYIDPLNYFGAIQDSTAMAVGE